MAGQRQPTDLVVMNGRKHLTKAEIEARKNAEVVAPNDKVKPPSYLTPEQKKKFRKIAKELLEIKLIANVDCDALARLLIAQDQYIEITQQIRTTPLMEDVAAYETKTNPDTEPFILEYCTRDNCAEVKARAEEFYEKAFMNLMSRLN